MEEVECKLHLLARYLLFVLFLNLTFAEEVLPEAGREPQIGLKEWRNSSAAGEIGQKLDHIGWVVPY